MKNKPELEPIVAPRYELKDGYLTITVNTYNNAAEKPKYVIKRISRSNLSDFIKLYECLIEEYVYYNFEIGSIIATDRGWQLLKDIAKLVPVIKNGDKVALDIEELEDDYEMITMLFLTEDVTEKGVGTDPEPGLKSSLLSRLNHLDQQSLLGKLRTIYCPKNGSHGLINGAAIPSQCKPCKHCGYAKITTYDHYCDNCKRCLTCDRVIKRFI